TLAAATSVTSTNSNSNSNPNSNSNSNFNSNSSFPSSSPGAAATTTSPSANSATKGPNGSPGKLNPHSNTFTTTGGAETYRSIVSTSTVGFGVRKPSGSEPGSADAGVPHVSNVFAGVGGATATTTARRGTNDATNGTSATSPSSTQH